VSEGTRSRARLRAERLLAGFPPPAFASTNGLLTSSAEQAGDEEEPDQDQRHAANHREDTGYATGAAQEWAGAIDQDARHEERYSLPQPKGQHEDGRLQWRQGSCCGQYQNRGKNGRATGGPARAKCQADET